jgi:hypothetical protein
MQTFGLSFKKGEFHVRMTPVSFLQAMCYTSSRQQVDGSHDCITLGNSFAGTHVTDNVIILVNFLKSMTNI